MSPPPIDIRVRGSSRAAAIEGNNAKDAWKGEREASRSGITDSKVGVADALKKGERGSMVINQLRWDSKFGGLINTLTITGTVTIGTDEAYDVEIGRQSIPHYATHLATVGRTVPVVVSVKRLDKVTIDWPSAAMAEPGIGVAPSTERSWRKPSRRPPSVTLVSTTYSSTRRGESFWLTSLTSIPTMRPRTR